MDYGSFDGGSVKFVPNSAASYQLIIRVHFYEEFPGVTYSKSVDYLLGSKNAKDAETFAGQSLLNYTFKRVDFFTAMGVGLSKMNLNTRDALGRKAYKIDFLIYSATQEYMDYLQYVSPSLSVAQTKPLYSNFENQDALGIFTFRTRCTVPKEMATTFINEFARNSNTCFYKFRASDNSLPGCN